MGTPSICTICNQSSEITYKLQAAIHHPDSFSFDGAKDLEKTFRKILKLNSSEQNQHSYVCQQCNYEFCRTYGVLHRFAQTENIFLPLKSVTVPKGKVTAMRTVNPMLDPKDSSQVVIEEESAENASNLQSNDELKLAAIKQEFDESNNIVEVPLAIKKEELFIDDTATESTDVRAQPPTIVATTHRSNILSCPECGQIFSSVQALKFHRRRRNHYSGKFTCDQCNAIFKNYHKFRLHKTSHFDPSFDCSKCNAKFLYRRSLTRHMKNHMCGTGVRFACPKCPAEFANKLHLMLHFAQRKFTCKICREDFHSQVQLETHHKVHLIKKHSRIIYKCNDCDLIIHEKQALYKHQLIHRKKSDLVGQPGRYHEAFANQAALKSDIETRLQKYYMYMCKQCGKRFTSLPTFRSHQFLHTEPKFACDQCDAKYYFQDSLETHRTVHTRAVEFQYNKYVKNLADMKSLKKHERESHLNKHKEKAISLKLSGDSDQSALETHEKSIHSEKTFDCFECDAKYPNPELLKLHQRMHTIGCIPSIKHYGKKTISLKLSDDSDQSCSKLPDKSALETHEKNVPRKNTYECFECDAKYPNPQLLKLHQRLHTIDRKEKNSPTATDPCPSKCFECERCGSKFKEIEILRRHKAMHTVGTHECNKCLAKFRTIVQLQTHEKHVHICSDEDDETLAKHQRSCDRCDAKFQNWLRYSIHKENSTGSLRHCDKCSLKFCTDQTYNEHRSEHGEFRCDHCGIKFIYQENLSKHLEIVHKWDGDGTALLSMDVEKDDEEYEVIYVEIASDEE